MQEKLYTTADTEVSLSDSGSRSLSIRQRMQKSVYQTADAGVSLSDSLCRRHSNTQQMQKSLYQTADAEVSLSDSGCRGHSIRQRLHLIESLLHPFLIERLLHPLSDRETSASAVCKSVSCIRCVIKVFPASAV